MYKRQGCKCTHIDERPTIAAGETVKLEISYAPRTLGKQTDKIIIVTNDPANPIYELKVHTNTVKTLATPSGIMLNQQSKGFGF